MSLCHAMLWEVSSINHHLPLAHHLYCIERASQYRVALLYLYLCSAEPESPEQIQSALSFLIKCA